MCADPRPNIRSVSDGWRAELSSLPAGVTVEPGRLQGLPLDQKPVTRVIPQDRSALRQVFVWIFRVIALAGFVCAAADAGSQGRDAKREVDEVLRLRANPARGAELFTLCAPCHGAQAHGLPAGWVPQIAGQHPRYLTKELVDYRRSVRWDARMQPIARGHALRDAQDIADVVAFIAAQIPDADSDADDAAVLPEVKGFYRSQCSRCHGGSGGGDDKRAVPRIAGQDFAYLLRQMHDVVDGRRPNMRRQHLQALEDLDVQDLVRLACYVSHLGANDGRTGTSELTTAVERWPRAFRSAR